MIPETIYIRKAGPDDLAILQQTGKDTFYETFAPVNSEADMARYLSDSFSDHKVREELNHPETAFYLAFSGAEPVGYLKVNNGSAQTELQDNTSLEIERIYVLASWQGKKVGQLLFETALEIARSQQKAYIWLGVWEKNSKAIRFYEKNGFVAFDQHLFRLGDDIQTDIMMKKML